MGGARSPLARFRRRSSSFNRRILTVTPKSLRPAICDPSILNRSCHLSVRGLNKRMNEPVFSVTEPMSLPFARLHRFHVPRTFPDHGIDRKVGKAGNAESNLLKHEMAMWTSTSDRGSRAGAHALSRPNQPL